VSFNLGQLRALEALASVAKSWNRKMKRLDVAVTGYTEAGAGGSVSRISGSIDGVLRSCNRLLDIAEQAVP